MKALLKSLFELSGFQFQTLEDFTIYYRAEESSKREYWIVIEGLGETILERQASIAEMCRKHISAPELDKNSSLVILDMVDSEGVAKAKKASAISVEEDPYHFKKYCLIFADSEVRDLVEQIGGSDIDTFLKKIIVDPNCFAQYKSNPQKLSWQSLVYRLANKLPFIKIKVTTNKGLKPLFESNLEKVKQKKLEQLNGIVQALDLLYSKEELADLSPVDLMETLYPLKMNKDEDKKD